MSFHHTHHRDDLAGEHRTGDLGQLIIFILFMVVYITDSFLNYSNFLNHLVPLFIRIPVAVVILSNSLYMAITGMNLVFGKNRQGPGVIRKGVFKLVRHPIYLSEILLYFGLLMFNMSLAATAIWIAGILFLHYISRYEEKLLLEQFGEEYARYMKEVAMWIPGVRKR